MNETNTMPNTSEATMSNTLITNALIKISNAGQAFPPASIVRPAVRRELVSLGLAYLMDMHGQDRIVLTSKGKELVG